MRDYGLRKCYICLQLAVWAPHRLSKQELRWNKSYRLVKLNDKYGFIDKTAKTVIPCLYDFSSWQRYKSPVLVEVKMNKKLLGYINKEGLQYWED